MTTEVVLMNTRGVALAADSMRTTVAGMEIIKTVPTAKKLHRISEHQPIGIMYYNVESFVNIPWEVVISRYREVLGKRTFDNVDGYVSFFLTLLKEDDCLRKEIDEEESIKGLLGAYCDGLIERARRTVNEKSPDRKVNAFYRHLVEQDLKDLETAIPVAELTDSEPNFKDKYGNFILQYVNFTELHVLDDKCKDLLVEYFTRRLTRISLDRFDSLTSGVVFVGYGDKDLFPRYRHIVVEGIVNDAVRYIKLTDEEQDVAATSSGIVAPFAQKDMIETFFYGISPDYVGHVVELITQPYKEFLDLVIETHPVLTGKKTMLLRKLSKKEEEAKDVAEHVILEYGRDKSLWPAQDVLASLSVVDLAQVAESLVSLACLKAKVSLGVETVGGSIDVATITKDKGFKWIKEQKS